MGIRIKKKFNEILEEDRYFIFWVSLLFYLFLYFNPHNTTLVLFFAFFIFLLFTRFKNLEEALFWGFIASFPFKVGKSYFFTLIPAHLLFAPEIPEGYRAKFVFTVGNIIAIFMFFSLLKKLAVLRKNVSSSLDWGFICLILLIFLAFLSTLYSKNLGLSFLFFLQFLQGPLAFLYARYLMNWGKKTHDVLLFLLLSQAVFQGVWVGLQFINGGRLGSSIESYWGTVPFGGGADEYFSYRPTGTLDHANLVAAFLLPISMLNFTVFYIKRYTKDKCYLLATFVLSSLALVITLSRSAWFSLFLAMLILAYILEKRFKLSLPKLYQKKLPLIFLPILFISPFFILPRIERTFYALASGGGITTRIKLIRESLELIGQNILLGTGLSMSVPEMFYNNPRGIIYYFSSPVHNWYLLFASEVGIPALLVFIFLVNFSLRKILLKGKKNTFLVGVFVACIAVLINGLFQPFLGSSLEDNNLLFIFLGILGST